MFYLISFIFPLVYFLLFTAFLVHLTRRSFGKCLPLSMIITAFILFVSQILFSTFSLGFFSCIAIAFSSILITFLRRKDLSSFKKRFFSGGLIAFLIVYILVFIFDFNRQLAAWDELSHWGMMVKEMFRLDKFYSDPNSNLTVHKDYPPILPLFELFWVKLCGSFNECVLERALHTFEFSLFVPLILEKIKRTTTLRVILTSSVLFFCIALTILNFDLHGVFNTIYTDYALSLVTVYAILVIFWSKKLSWFELTAVTLSGGFLLLMKQIGLPIYLILGVILAGRFFFDSDQSAGTFFRKNLKKLALSSFILLLPFLALSTWNHISSSTAKQFDTSSIVSSTINLLSKRGTPWQLAAIRNFINALANFSILNSNIKLGYIQLVLIYFCCSCLLWHKQTNRKKPFFAFITTILSIGSVGYAFTMIILYATSFGPEEGPALASYERYMSSYLLIPYLFLIVAALDVFSFKSKPLLLLMTFSILLVTPSALLRLYPVIKKPGPTHYNLIAQDLLKTAENNSNIYFISETKGPKQGWQYFVQYYATPIRLSWHPGEHSWHSRYWDVDPESDHKEAFKSYKQEIKQADYLLFTDIDDSFKRYYAPLLKIDSPEDGQLYRINKDSAGEILNFELVTSLEHY